MDKSEAFEVRILPTSIYMTYTADTQNILFKSLYIFVSILFSHISPY